MKRGLRTVAALWLTVIFAASLAPTALKTSLNTHGPMHGVLHFGAFFIAAFLMTFGAPGWRYRLLRGSMALTFAITTEYLETSIYLNGIEWTDVRNDAFGIAAGLLAAFLLRGDFRSSPWPLSRLRGAEQPRDTVRHYPVI
jgi:hypothetical protein